MTWTAQNSIIRIVRQMAFFFNYSNEIFPFFPFFFFFVFTTISDASAAIVFDVASCTHLSVEPSHTVQGCWSWCSQSSAFYASSFSSLSQPWLEAPLANRQAALLPCHQPVFGGGGCRRRGLAAAVMWELWRQMKCQLCSAVPQG